MMKFLLSKKRKNTTKAKKDLYTAIELSQYLINIEREKEKFKYYFSKMPNKWKKECLEVIKAEYNTLYSILSKSE
ncbi:MAG: hypothetical protein APR63_09325 [Desulfuromonas sp. SDB]|nr:MAG: hypothetical protein APR63_09325 [Desulfuromonas sp. SDB]